jgi:isoamylase
MYLNGEGIRGRDARGERVTDVAFLTYFNAHHDVVTFTLPPEEYSPGWTVRIDTADPGAREEILEAGQALDVPGRSMIVLRAEPEHEIQRTPVDTTTHAATGPAAVGAAQTDPAHPEATPANPAGSSAPSAAGTSGVSGVPDAATPPGTPDAAADPDPDPDKDTDTDTDTAADPDATDPDGPDTTTPDAETPDSDTPGSAA